MFVCSVFRVRSCGIRSCVCKQTLAPRLAPTVSNFIHFRQYFQHSILCFSCTNQGHLIHLPNLCFPAVPFCLLPRIQIHVNRCWIALTFQRPCHNTTTLQSAALTQTSHTWLSTHYPMMPRRRGREETSCGDMLKRCTWRLGWGGSTKERQQAAVSVHLRYL